MKLLIGLFLLLNSPVCYAMRACDVRSDEEYFSDSDCQDESWHRNDEAKKPKVDTKKPAAGGDCYIVDFDNPHKILSFKNRGALIKKYLRSLARAQGFTHKSISHGFELTDSMPRQRNGTRFLLECPDTSCTVKLQSETSKTEVIRHLFRHWFLTSTHQPALYEELLQLIGEDKVQAEKFYKKYGMPKSNIISLLDVIDSDVQPMDLEKEDDQEDEWEGQKECKKEQHDSSSPDYSALLGVQAMEIDEGLYIATDSTGHTSSFVILEEPTRHEVVARYCQMQTPFLTLKSIEVKEQGKVLQSHEEIKKQLTVQRFKELKALICPIELCDFMVTQEPNDQKLDSLYYQIALHYVQSHTDQADNVLAQKAAKLAAPSFKRALELHANGSGPSKQRRPQ